MANMSEVLRIVAASGYVMKDFEMLNDPSKVETVSKEIYRTINNTPFVYNKRLMQSLKIANRIKDMYKTGFNRIRDIAVVSPIDGSAEFVKAP